MTSKLRIDLSHKTEQVRFSGTPPLNYVTAMHSYLSFGRKTLKFEAHMLLYTNLNSNCQNLPNVSYTHEGQFGEICLTKLRHKNSVRLRSLCMT